MVATCENKECKTQDYEGMLFLFLFAFTLCLFSSLLLIDASLNFFQFLREQAAQCAAEITQDRVNDFVADSESDVEDLTEDSRKSLQWWEKILVNVKQF